MTGKLDVIRHLVENGANVNVRSNNGKTALTFGKRLEYI